MWCKFVLVSVNVPFGEFRLRTLRLTSAKMGATPVSAAVGRLLLNIRLLLPLTLHIRVFLFRVFRFLVNKSAQFSSRRKSLF